MYYTRMYIIQRFILTRNIFYFIGNYNLDIKVRKKKKGWSSEKFCQAGRFKYQISVTWILFEILRFA